MCVFLIKKKEIHKPPGCSSALCCLFKMVPCRARKEVYMGGM